MVVFRSPAQRQTSMLATSPLPSGLPDEDLDDLFKATPGPSAPRDYDTSEQRAGSSSHVRTGYSAEPRSNAGNSALLRRKLAHSLQLVADSPSSKLNAPDPFRPKHQLRRSPPAAPAFDHAASSSKQQLVESSKDPSGTPRQGTPSSVLAKATVADLPTTTNGTAKAKDYSIAAKALFNRRSEERDKNSRARSRGSLPASGAHFLTPQASTSGHRPSSSLPDAVVHHSAPLRSTRSENAAPSGEAGQLASNGTPVQYAARIGRLTAKAAHAEAVLQSRSRQLEIRSAEFDALSLQYNAVCARIQDYETLASDCEEAIIAYELLKSDSATLVKEKQLAIVKLLDTKEACTELESSQRSLMQKMHNQREEIAHMQDMVGNPESNPAVRAASWEALRLKAQVTALKEAASLLTYENDITKQALDSALEDEAWYLDSLAAARADLAALKANMQARTSDGDSQKAELEGHLAELKQAIRDREKLEKECADLRQKLEIAQQNNDGTSRAKEMYRDSQIHVRKLEKEAKSLQAALIAAEEETSKQDLEEEVAKYRKENKQLEATCRLRTEERDKLQASWDMHSRAARVFGDSPGTTAAEAGLGAALPELIEGPLHTEGQSQASLRGTADPAVNKRRKRTHRKEDSVIDEPIQDQLSLGPPVSIDSQQSDSQGSKTGRSGAIAAKSTKTAARTDKTAAGASQPRAKKPRQAEESSSSDSDGEGLKASSSSESEEDPVRVRVPKGASRKARKSGTSRTAGQKRAVASPMIKSKSRGNAKAGSKVLAQNSDSESDTVEVASSPRQSPVTTDKGKKGTSNAASQQGNTSSKSSVAAPLRKKVALHGASARPFVWKEASQGANKSQFGLPDVLSPMVSKK